MLFGDWANLNCLAMISVVYGTRLIPAISGAIKMINLDSKFETKDLRMKFEYGLYRESLPSLSWMK